jgi:3-dehydroquinate dehydratase-2
MLAGLMQKTVFIFNGPNLNLLGQREPEIYGKTTLEDIRNMCEKEAASLSLITDFRQSNTEGELVAWIQEAREKADGLIINAGGYTHTSVAIHDALKAYQKPSFEVHISNIHAREAFRHTSLLSAAVTGVICGFGAKGYVYALHAAYDHFRAG